MICADELGPVIPRAFPPAPGWSVDGHRVKAELDSGRGPDKTWGFGALRPTDGQVVTLTGPSRNSAGYQRLLAKVEATNPTGQHRGGHRQPVYPLKLVDPAVAGRASAAAAGVHPKGACWLNLQEGWWRLFRRQALAGVSFATPDEIALATRVATCQLNTRARPWIWGRPPPPSRYRRRVLIYRI